MNTLGIDVPLLSDLNGEATRGFGVSFELFGIQNVAARSCFLIEDAETIQGCVARIGAPGRRRGHRGGAGVLGLARSAPRRRSHSASTSAPKSSASPESQSQTSMTIAAESDPQVLLYDPKPDA